MSIPKLTPVLVGLPTDIKALVANALSKSDMVGVGPSVLKTQEAVALLVENKANSVFLNPAVEDWRVVQELLQLCRETFPVAIFGDSKWLATFPGVPPRAQAELRKYYLVRTDAALPELGEQIQYVIRGCHRYILKKVVRANLGQIAKQDPSADPQKIAKKAEEATNALVEIEQQDKSGLRDSLGLNSEQMRGLFDETLQHARDMAKRAEFANLATLGAGLLLVLGVAIVALVRQSADPWTFATGGMGAAATIAALITSPGRRVANGASKLIYVQTAYFSFLSQVRMLNAAGPESSLERSERLDKATSNLLERLRSDDAAKPSTRTK